MRSSSDPRVVGDVVVVVIVVGDEEVGGGGGVDAVGASQSAVVVVGAVLPLVAERRGREIRASSSPGRGFRAKFL